MLSYKPRKTKRVNNSLSSSVLHHKYFVDSAFREQLSILEMKGEADAQDLILHVNSKSTKSEDARKTSGMKDTGKARAELHATTQSGALSE
jgi:hypothetical protein